jgi:hypothetical protein
MQRPRLTSLAVAAIIGLPLVVLLVIAPPVPTNASTVTPPSLSRVVVVPSGTEWTVAPPSTCYFSTEWGSYPHSGQVYGNFTTSNGGEIFLLTGAQAANYSAGSSSCGGDNRTAPNATGAVPPSAFLFSTGQVDDGSIS